MTRNCSLRLYWRGNLAKTNKTSIVIVYSVGKSVPRFTPQRVSFYLRAVAFSIKGGIALIFTYIPQNIVSPDKYLHSPGGKFFIDTRPIRIRLIDTVIKSTRLHKVSI